MKALLTGAAALSFALVQTAATPALAEEAAAPFRTAAPQTFSTEDLQRYGLSEADAERAIAYQDEGYALKVLSEEEAEQYRAGITDDQWLMIGILAGVIIIAIAVAD